MKEMLNKIIDKCYDNKLKVSVEKRDEEYAFRVEGFSKSGSALLYVDGDEIICETRYGQKDHLLTFDDLVLVAKSWYENYRDRTPFEHPEPEWIPIFREFYDNKKDLSDCEDLPF